MATLLGTDTIIIGTSLTTWTKTVTVPTNTNLVYVAGGLRNVSISSMSLSGGGSGASVVSLNAGVSGQPIAYIWRIPNTTTGSQTLTITLGTASSGAFAIYFVQGDTTTPEVSTNSVDVNASTTPSLTMTTVANSLVIDAIAAYNTISVSGTANGTQTEILDNFSNQLISMSSHITASGSSQSVGWTLTAGNNTAYVAAALTPFAGGGGPSAAAKARYRRLANFTNV